MMVMARAEKPEADVSVVWYLTKASRKNFLLSSVGFWMLEEGERARLEYYI